MENLTLTVIKHEYENRESASRLGHDYNVNDERGNRLSRASLSQYDAIDSALLEVMKRAANGYYETSVTITGATLPASLRSILTDKYETESQITSVIFES